MFKYTTILTIVNNSDIVPSIDEEKRVVEEKKLKLL